MLAQLINFELRYYSKQTVFYLGIVLLFLLGLPLMLNASPNEYFTNSPYMVVHGTIIVSTISIFITTVFASSSILRDDEYQMNALIFSTQPDKFAYLVSRFSGLVMVSFLLMSCTVLGMFAGSLFIDPAHSGNLRLDAFLWSLIVLVLPNVFLCASISYSVAILTKKTIAVYISGVLVYMLYIVGSILGNSPMMASSSALTTQGTGISTLLEPFGAIGFFQQTMYWSVQEKNNLLPSLSGKFLFNRVLWLTFSLSLFAFVYRYFSFQLKSKTDKGAQAEVNSGDLVRDVSFSFKPLISQILPNRFNVHVLISKLKIEYLSVIKGLPFIVLVVLLVFFFGISITEQINGGAEGSAPYFPLTSLIVEEFLWPLSKIGVFVAIFYAVELVWSERTHQFNFLADATQTPNATFYLSKVTILVAIIFTLITTACMVGMLFQISKGYTDFELDLYFSMYYYAGIPLLFFGIMTMFLQRFAPNKFTGIVFGATFFILSELIGNNLGIHPLTRFAYSPVFAFSHRFIYSDMAGIFYHGDAFNWYALYWGSFTGILAVMSVKHWNRGVGNTTLPFTSRNKTAIALCLCFFIGSGVYIFNETNVNARYSTKVSHMDFREQYEKNYTSYKNDPQPTVTDIKVSVDIFPKEKKYSAKGTYTIENKTSAPLKKALVSFQMFHALEYDVSIEGATRVEANKDFQVLVFNFEKPLAVGETRQLTFNINQFRSPFKRLDGEHYITDGATYFELEDALPTFGYLEQNEIENPYERKKRGLPEQTENMPKEGFNGSEDNWLNYEAVISTDQNQTVVTTGNLLKEWKENDRAYFHYKSDGKIARAFAVTSAKYEIETMMHKGIEISIYHSPKHTKDTNAMFEAMKQTLDYFQENFTPYQYKNFRIVELPYFSAAQSFGVAYPGIYYGVSNRFFNMDHSKTKGNGALRGIAHEFGHQYWGNQIEPASGLNGYATMTEMLSKYTEVALYEKVYGTYGSKPLVEFALDLYLRLRSQSGSTEPSLHEVSNEAHIYYAKGLHSMAALRDMIGEQTVNLALKRFLENNKYPKKPVSFDLLNEFYAVTPIEKHRFIDDLFKRRVFHDLRLNDVHVNSLDNGTFEITIETTTKKSVLGPASKKEVAEPINDELDIAFFSGYPDEHNKNMTYIQKYRFTQEQTKLTIITNEKPKVIAIDPNRLRVDRLFQDNLKEL